MFPTLFFALRQAKVPVSLKEYLALMDAMAKGVAAYDIDDFYYLARTILVKDERHLDKFDRIFGEVFKGLETPEGESLADIDLPEEWLRRLAELHLTDEEKRQVEAMGGFEALMETLRRRLSEQTGRHQGGSKWIGTAGRSPFGAYGYNPEGVRIGQDRSRHRRAVKVWDRRDFRNLDDSIELGTRNIKIALRRLRRFARQGAADTLDLAGTIGATARNGGWLDVQWEAERHNAVKVLLFLDVGGSMDDHVRISEELFSAARSEFKHLEYYYFHNCPYEVVWRDNRRRWTETTPTAEVLHTYPADYRLIFVGDAAMSPYEVSHPGGSVEHWNDEPGELWLRRLTETYPRFVWLNPMPERFWAYTPSIAMIRALVDHRMLPLTLAGLDEAMRLLSR